MRAGDSLVYILEGDFPKGDEGFPLIRKAALMYGQEMWGSEAAAAMAGRMDIERRKGGKPYFPLLELEFSLSHSEELWMCAFSEGPCGLDVQKIRPCSWEKIAERHFGKQELRYAELFGEEGFFQLWVRKEALGKYTGKGFFGATPPLADQEHRLVDRVNLDGKELYLKEIHIADHIKCAFCSEQDVTPGFRLLT